MTTTPNSKAAIEKALLKHRYSGIAEGPGYRAVICSCGEEFKAIDFAGHQAERINVEMMQTPVFELTVYEYEDTQSLGFYDSEDEALKALGRYCIANPAAVCLRPHITEV